MSLPTPGDRHVNRPLTDMAIAHFQRSSAFVTAMSVPVIRSLTKSNEFFEFDKADLHRIEVKARAPVTRAAQGGYRLSRSTFTTQRFSIAHCLSDEDLNNYDAPLDPEKDGVEYVSNQMLMHRENEWASACFATGLYDIDLDGVAGVPGANQFKQWDQAGSEPIADIRGQKIAVGKATGYEPNTCYIGREVWNTLVDHPEIVDRMQASGIPSGSRTPLSTEMFAQLLEVDRVVVGSSIKNTAAEGLAAVNEYILGKNLLLAYVNPEANARVKQPSAFYTFVWNGFAGAEAEGFRIKRYREEALSSDVIEGDTSFVHKLTGTDMGAFFEDAVA